MRSECIPSQTLYGNTRGAGLQREVLAAQQSLERLVAEAQDAILVLDGTETIRFANPAAKQLFFGRCENLVGRPLGYPATSSEVTELDVPLRDGRVRTVEMRVSNTEWRGESAKLIIFRDVTERKLAETALRKARDELEERVKERTAELVKANETLREQAALLDLAHDAILVCDLGGRILYWNKGAEKTYGWARDEALGKNVHDLLRTQSPKPPEEITEDLLDSSEWEGELRHVTRNGESLTVASRWAVQKDVNGNPTGILEINRDITERKKMELALRESEELFRSLAENSLTGVALYRDRIQYVNATLERITGYSRDELLKMDIRQLFHPDYREYIGDMVRRRMNGEKLVSAYDELKIIKKNGDERWTQAYANTVEYKGQFCGLANFIDVTEQKKLREEVVKSRTLESTGILAGGIAHDFNNVMSVILGNMNLAQYYLPTNGPAYKLLLNAEKAILRAKDLTNQFITLSRAGVPSKEVHSIEELIKECIGLILEEDAYMCRMILSDDLRQVEVDRKQMRQALINVIKNAWEATNGQGSVDIRAQNVVISSTANRPFLRMQEGPYVKIEILDRGKGISQEDLPFIFDPYFSTKERGTQKGMGLGLTIAQSIVSKHNGHVQVDSEPGKGTVVSIWLPALSMGFAP